jgi:hypothetical protein
MTREGAFKIFIATSGCRKTSDIKVLIKDDVLRRNLVVPSGRDDIAWHGYPELKWSVIMVDDEWKPGRKVPKVIIPELNTFKGTRVLNVDGKQPIFDAIIDPISGFRNGRVVLDDFRNYVYSNGNLRHEVATFFKNRRHKMLDIFMACHSMEDISRQMLSLNPKLVIGMTTTLPTDTSINKIPKGQEMLDMIARVNAINIARPEGERYYKEELQM